MQRQYNLDKWTVLQEGQVLDFANPRPRTVRLDVNAPVKTALYVADREGEARFLALVEGRDVIEWSTTGAFQLTVEGFDCHVYTVDGDDVSMKVIAPKIFTKIAERRRRNPELEEIAYMMQRNMERRLEQQSHELAQLYERRATLERGNQSPPPGVSGDAGKEQGSADGADAPDTKGADAAGRTEPPETDSGDGPASAAGTTKSGKRSGVS